MVKLIRGNAAVRETANARKFGAETDTISKPNEMAGGLSFPDKKTSGFANLRSSGSPVSVRKDGNDLLHISVVVAPADVWIHPFVVSHTVTAWRTL